MTQIDFFINCLSQSELRQFAHQEDMEIPETIYRDSDIKTYLMNECKACSSFLNLKKSLLKFLKPKNKRKLDLIISEQKLKISTSKSEQNLRKSILTHFSNLPKTAEEISEQEEELEEEQTQQEELHRIKEIINGKNSTKTTKKAKTYNPYFFYANIFQKYNRDYFIIKNRGSKKPKTANNDTIILFQHLVALGKRWKEKQGLDEFFHSHKQIEADCNIGVNAQKVILPFLEQKKIISRRWSQKENKTWFTIHFKQIIKQADKIFNVEKAELQQIKAFFNV
jgi:lysyl-tRNA synthetase class I